MIRKLLIGLMMLCVLIPRSLLAESSFDHTHEAFTRILQEYVVEHDGKSSVRYKDLQSAPDALSAYLRSLSEVSRERFDSFSRDEQLAFLINAYNGFTIQLVLDHYPVDSIKDIGGWFSTPWKKDFFTLLGETHSLDDIEHEMIRKWFDEPRIHFALVCAARSCPPLRAEAFTATRLESMLEASAKNFLQDSDRNYYDSSKRQFHLSSIFKWYGDDFNERYGSMKKFVSRYYEGSSPEQRVTFLSYDWSLNER